MTLARWLWGRWVRKRRGQSDEQGKGETKAGGQEFVMVKKERRQKDRGEAK